MIPYAQRRCIKNNLISKMNRILLPRCAELFDIPSFSDLMMVNPHSISDIGIVKSEVPIIRMVNKVKTYPVRYQLPAEMRISVFPSISNKAIRTLFGLETFDGGIEFTCTTSGEISQVIIKQPAHSIPIYKDWYPEFYDLVYAYAALARDFELLREYVRYLYTNCSTYNQMEYTLPGIKQFFHSQHRGISGRTTKPHYQPLPENLRTCWAVLNLE